MKKFRQLLIAAASLMGVSALTGCGQQGVPDNGYLIKVWGTFNVFLLSLDVDNKESLTTVISSKYGEHLTTPMVQSLTKQSTK